MLAVYCADRNCEGGTVLGKGWQSQWARVHRRLDDVRAVYVGAPGGTDDAIDVVLSFFMAPATSGAELSAVDVVSASGRTPSAPCPILGARWEQWTVRRCGQARWFYLRIGASPA